MNKINESCYFDIKRLTAINSIYIILLKRGYFINKSSLINLNKIHNFIMLNFTLLMKNN